MTAKSYRVRLVTPDQFGEDGPQPGAEGWVVQETHIIDEPRELYKLVVFDNFFDATYWVEHYMVEKL